MLQSQGMNIDSDRYRGYLDALSNRGVLTNPKWLFSGIGNLEEGRKIMYQILQMSERPEANHCGKREVAAGMDDGSCCRMVFEFRRIWQL